MAHSPIETGFLAAMPPVKEQADATSTVTQWVGGTHLASPHEKHESRRAKLWALQLGQLQSPAPRSCVRNLQMSRGDSAAGL